MNSLDHKICPQCSEPVRITAKKCPFCLSWQGRKASLNNPAMLAFLPMLVFLPVYWFGIRSINRPVHLFDDYRSQVQVMSTEMNCSVADGKNMLSSIGQIRNNSSVTWGDVAIEVQCFNGAGKLIDTYSDRNVELTLAPHTEQAFRVRFEADKPGTEYVTQRVFLRDASDAHRW